MPVVVLAVLVVALCVLVVLGAACLWAAAPRRTGLTAVQARVAQLGESEPVLVIDGSEHPPWAQAHFITADFDYDQGTITVVERSIGFNPFASRAYGRWPLVVRNGLLPGSYSVRYWDGSGAVPLGRLEVGDSGALGFFPTRNDRSAGEKHQ
jgi:hypothetical protein